MFAIEATNARKWRWIAGIFQHLDDAEQFLNSVPIQARAMQRIVEFPLQCYPVFIVEDQGFEYGDLDFVRAKLSALLPCGDEDQIHMNIYAVREDFVPAPPGVDSMGGLLHWHVTDWTLQPPRSAVFDEELSEIAEKTL
ncbi:MAG: hypothetical protein ACOVOX_01680 [Burkholderiaceae bacterium]